jgi:hypothetical protein
MDVSMLSSNLSEMQARQSAFKMRKNSKLQFAPTPLNANHLLSQDTSTAILSPLKLERG